MIRLTEPGLDGTYRTSTSYKSHPNQVPSAGLGIGRFESYLRQLIGVAPLAVEPFVGLRVVDEPPGRRVPVQLAVVPVSQVPQVAHRNRAGADLDVAQRP